MADAGDTQLLTLVSEWDSREALDGFLASREFLILQGMRVERVERGRAAAVQAEGARVEPRARGRLRHLLDQGGELHRRDPTRLKSLHVPAECSASLRAF